MDLAGVIGWVRANPVADVAVAAWLVANVAPRPRPDQVESKGARVFWFVLDRICFLTAQKVPGNLKWILAASPVPVEDFDRPTRPDLQAVPEDPPNPKKGDEQP